MLEKGPTPTLGADKESVLNDFLSRFQKQVSAISELNHEVYSSLNRLSSPEVPAASNDEPVDKPHDICGKLFLVLSQLENTGNLLHENVNRLNKLI